MPPQPLNTSKYEILPAADSEMEEVMTVCELAFANDAIWKIMFGQCSDEGIHQFMMKDLVGRWLMPDIETFVVKEKSTGKIVAWTALQFPWAWRKDMTDEHKVLAADHSLPPNLPPGYHFDAVMEFLHMLSATDNYGYDPELEYHRRGTMVHPSFQKQGLGSALTAHTNAIADSRPARTWAPVRPSSHKMFNDLGFRDIGFVDHKLERWGGPEGVHTWAVRRDI